MAGKEWGTQRVYLNNMGAEGFDDPNAIFKMRAAGLVIGNPNYRNRQVMPDTLFEYIMDGSGYIRHSGKEYTVKKGDCIIARPDTFSGQPLIYGSSKEHPYTKLWFAAGGKFIDNMLRTYNVTEIVNIKHIEISKLFEDFLVDVSQQKPDDIKSMQTVVAIMHEFFADKPVEPVDADFSAFIHRYLEKNCINQPSVKAASKNLGMTQRAFQQYFRINYNMTYNAYMRTLRLHVAKSMLEYSALTVSQIADTLKFYDQSYFSRCFKGQYGIYPTDYRRKFREERKNIIESGKK